jgi:DNA-directed RNA polymerase specialized sigma24 family protein
MSITPADIVATTLPKLGGYIHNNYRWIEDRGHCLLTVDDLKQVASIQMLDLAERWPAIAEDRGFPDDRDAQEKLFWAFLKHEVKQAVQEHVQSVTRQYKEGPSSHNSLDDFDPNARSEHPDDVRTALWRYAPPSMLLEDVVDFFTIQPVQDKLAIALRYFDGLSLEMLAGMMGIEPASCRSRAKRASKRILDYAKNQCVDEPNDLEPRRTHGWETPEAITNYVRNRYRTDVANYLGYVTLCFRADVSYLVDILDAGNGGVFRSPLAVNGRATLTASQLFEIDARLGGGETQSQIARDMALPIATVQSAAHRQVAA